MGVVCTVGVVYVVDMACAMNAGIISIVNVVCESWVWFVMWVWFL